MAANQQAAAPAKEYIVRVTKDTKKLHSIMKFNPSNNVDFTKLGTVKLERENNHKEFKQAYDIDAMPKFGAGSEFGREAREEARKKKFGIKIKKYIPEAQPWILKVGTDKNVKKFKGLKEGGILENASYYIFTQCPDGAFEAFPVEEWHNFTPLAKYKVLNSEEVEEEYLRRDKTLNYFSIMLKKRLKNEDEVEEDDDGKKVSKSKKKKDFMLTDLDDWAILSEEDESDEDGNDKEESAEKKKKPKKPAAKGKAKKKSRKKKNSDDEAEEDSDDLDEGKEVDYMTSSDSEDDAMYAESSKVKSEKYDEKGVVEEDGLRKFLDSDEDDEEEKKVGEEEKKEDDEEPTKEGKVKKEGSDSDSSSSSDSESDVEKDAVFAKALFMQKSKEKGKKGRQSNDSTPVNSRSATPTVPGDGEEKGKKRKGGDIDSSSSKKPRVSMPSLGVAAHASGSGTSSSDGINDEAVCRYLMRKPMTTKELLIKFRNTGLNKDQLVTSLAQILKRLNPERKQIKDKLYLSIKKPE